jgi:hypothetical protein
VFAFVFKLNFLLIIRPAGNSGLAKAAIKFCAKIEHPFSSICHRFKFYFNFFFCYKSSLVEATSANSTLAALKRPPICKTLAVIAVDSK